METPRLKILSDAFDEALAASAKAAKPLARLSSCKTDALFGGIRRGSSTILAGVTSIGKTALAVSWATDLASRGQAVIYFSYEMPSAALIWRSIAQHGGGSFTVEQIANHLGGGEKNEGVRSLIDSYRETVAPHICFEDRRIPQESLPLAIKHFAEDYSCVPIIELDYAQIVPSRDQKLSSYDQARLNETIRLTKKACRDTGAAMIAISSISRTAYKSKAPGLSDLGGSALLEFSADVVATLSPADDRKGKGPGGSTRLRLATIKNRYGPIGEVELDYFPEYARFEEA